MVTVRGSAESVESRLLAGCCGARAAGCSGRGGMPAGGGSRCRAAGRSSGRAGRGAAGAGGRMSFFLPACGRGVVTGPR